MTPAQLAVSATCDCLNNDDWKKVVIFLLATQAGLAGQTPAQLAASATCYCFTDDQWKQVSTYLLAKIAGLS